MVITINSLRPSDIFPTRILYEGVPGFAIAFTPFDAAIPDFAQHVSTRFIGYQL